MLQRFWGWLEGRLFLKNISILMAGTLSAHVITVGALPISTRLYAPEDFSILAIYSSTLSILLTLATLNLHIGLPIADTHRRALSLLAVSGLVLIAGALLIGLMVWIGNDLILAILPRPDFAPYLWLLAPGFLLGGGYALLQMWFSRLKKFSLIARTRVMRSVGGSGTQLGVGAFGGGAIGLVLGHVLYNGLGTVGLARKLWRNEKFTLLSLQSSDLADSLQRNRRYVYFTTPENLTNVAAIYLPVLMIAATPGAGEVGYLYLAHMVMTLPMMLVGSSVGQVFLVEAAERNREGRLFPFVLNVMRGLFLTGVPVLVGIGALAPFLAAPVLGADWQVTGNLIAWMTPWMVLQFVTSPLSTLFYVLERQALAMGVQIVSLLVRSGAVLIAISVAPAISMQVYAISGAFVYFSILVLLLLIARRGK